MTRLFFRLLLTCLLFAIAAQRSALAQAFEEKAYLANLRSYNQLPLDSLWFYQPGNASVGTDRATWTLVDAQFLRDRAGRPLAWSGVGWFRKQWQVPPGFRNRAVALRMGHFGASEIYLDGRLIQRYGTIGKTLAEEAIYLPRQPFIVQLDGQETHWLTVHYANRRANLPGYGNAFSGFRLLASAPVYQENGMGEFLPMLFSVTLAFAMLFGFIYVLYPARLASLFSALGLANASCLFFAIYLLNTVNEGAVLIPAAYVRDIAIGIGEAFLLLVTYLLFYGRLPRRAWLVIAWIAIIPVLIVSKLLGIGIIFAVSGLLTIERLRMLILGVWRQKNGFLILLVGYVLGQALLVGAALDVFNLFPVFTYTLGILLLLNGMIPPLTLALHLAWEFRTANRDLQLKLDQVETLSAEKQQILATQNEVLEVQVTERTAELQHKNRELEIEAALDKVRSRSLAMHKSDELQEVVVVVFDKLKELGLVFDGGAGIQLFTEGSKNSTLWVAVPSLITSPSRINLPYDADGFRDNPIILDVWTAKETGEAIYNKTYTRDEKNRYFEYVFKHNDLIQVPLVVRDQIMQAPSYTQAFVTEKNSGVIANSWSNEVFPPDKFDVFKRIAKVFDQAYIRFLDLQKAEAQAREAQIEVALEMIRSRSLAMHHSDELKGVMGVMFKKLTELEILIGTVAIQLFDEKTKSCEFWLQNQLEEPGLVKLPYDERMMKEDNYMKDSWEAKAKGESFFNKVQSFEQKKSHFEYVFAHNDDIPQPVREYILQAEHHSQTLIVEKNSALLVDSWDERIYGVEQIEVLKRVAKVFEQAYIRFLDLQKAEAQARESQIEVALERVRSRSMAMHQSHELAEAASVLFQQIKDLGYEMWSCGFCVWKQDDFSELWMSADSGGLLPPMLMPYKEEPTHRKIYEASLRQEHVHEYVWEGEELKKHYEYLYTIPSVKEAIDILEKSGLSLPAKQCYYVGFFNQGYLLIITKEPIPEMHDLSYRFTRVFEQTYTRFLDLQKAEAQAEQAKLDLIQIQTEKKRAEGALDELRITQTQLIQKEKLASLGELTAGIAHEIQNPLNFVNNFSEVSTELVEEMQDELDKGDTDEAKAIADDLKQNLQKITHHGGRASAIVRGMLEHSRTSTGEKQPTNLNALADEYLRLAYHGLRAKNSSFTCELVTDFDANLPPINVIAQDMGRVLLNLINQGFLIKLALGSKTELTCENGRKIRQVGLPCFWVSNALTN